MRPNPMKMKALSYSAFPSNKIPENQRLKSVLNAIF
jgi:hypothetical protein